MPVPDDVVFGPNLSNGEPLKYGAVRAITDSVERIRLVKKRLDDWLISPLAAVGAPFPTAILTCVSIETLGQILRGDSSNRDDRGESFKKVLASMDQRFSHSFPLPTKQLLRARWGRDDIKKPADLIYTYFRNSLIHVFQGQAVFLTGDETADMTTRDGDLLLNPSWFHLRFHATYEAAFQKMLQGPCGERDRCRAYIERLLA